MKTLTKDSYISLLESNVTRYELDIADITDNINRLNKLLEQKKKNIEYWKRDIEEAKASNKYEYVISRYG